MYFSKLVKFGFFLAVLIMIVPSSKMIKLEQNITITNINYQNKNSLIINNNKSNYNISLKNENINNNNINIYNSNN